jgi:hypothetical protein
MSKTRAAAVAEVEARQAMMRVWMAISAVWVAFWLCMAGLTFVTAEMSFAISNQLRLFALIVLAPPLALLAIGAALRWFFEGVLRKTKISEC